MASDLKAEWERIRWAVLITTAEKASWQEGWMVYAKPIAEELGIPFLAVKGAQRQLVNEGLMHWGHVFSEDTGLPAGSGYGLTDKGYALAKEMIEYDEELGRE